MRKWIGSVVCLALTGGLVVGAGCTKDESGKPMAKKPAMATTMPAAAAVAMSEKDMTHACTMEAPMYTAMPMAEGAKPAMMLKPGDKVMVMMPRGKYAQVTTVGGVKGYVPTAALKPIGM